MGQDKGNLRKKEGTIMKANALNYHLAAALLHLIKQSHSSLYTRFNLIVFIHGCIKATGCKTQEVKDAGDKITLLRETYEPEMDYSPYTYEKRIAFEIELDEVQDTLLKTVNERQLVSGRVMQEIMVGKWNEED